MKPKEIQIPVIRVQFDDFALFIRRTGCISLLPMVLLFEAELIWTCDPVQSAGCGIDSYSRPGNRRRKKKSAYGRKTSRSWISDDFDCNRKNEISKMNEKAPKRSRKKRRPEEIYRCLLAQYDLPHLTAKFPSVREIRTTFRCGQAAATAALNRLAEYYHFKRIPRGKSRLSLDFSNAGTNFTWYDFLYQKRECTIVFQQHIAFCWQPIVEEYNREHPNRPIRSHLVCHEEEFQSLASDSSIDLMLLPNHPAIVGLWKGLQGFKELTPLAKSLPKQNYYEAMFLYDTAGQLRGIAPALVPKLLFYNQYAGRLPEKGLPLKSLPGFLRKIKQKHPELLYAAIFDSYLNFFANGGLDPVESLAHHFKDFRKWEKMADFFRALYQEKLVPSISDLVNCNCGYPLFANGQTAMVELYYSKIPRFMEKGFIDFTLPLRAPGVSCSVVSEVLGICHGSIRYEQAWDFIEYVLQPRIQQLLLNRMNAFSILRGLRPLHMPESVYTRLEPMLHQAVRRTSDNIMVPQLFRCFESGIDYVIKYGTSIQNFLEDFLTQYQALTERGII